MGEVGGEENMIKLHRIRAQRIKRLFLRSRQEEDRSKDGQQREYLSKYTRQGLSDNHGE